MCACSEAPAVNEALVRDEATGAWLRFSAPLEIFVAGTVEDVLPCIEQVERAVERHGHWAAGYVSYEAAPAFDEALQTRPASGVPMAWFGVYSEPRPVRPPFTRPRRVLIRPDWTPTVSRQEYAHAIAFVKRQIEAGATYQVNYTFRQHAPFDSDPWELFLQMSANAPLGAFVLTERHALCSASPELFFRLRNGHAVARPMKGTAARGCTPADDSAAAVRLRASEKERAENVMIVDMIRNDLGRVARPGSVRVTSLYDTERYPTVWQMTSTVEADTAAPTLEILQAMFPCSSITGAPKVETMRIISELETCARNVYTGAIGYLAPGRRAQFNVAIRTVLVDLECGRAEYGAGGGIVWDSGVGEEYNECIAKTRVLASPVDAGMFDLLETMLWSPREGVYLLDRHLARLAESAAYFDYACDPEAVRRQVNLQVEGFGRDRMRVRVLVDRDGAVTCESAPLAAGPAGAAVRLAVARRPVSRDDPFIYHKTTRREVYTAALADARASGYDDALLWNEDGEVTETCIANIAVRKGQRLVTPPVRCGLLNGTLRSLLLERGELEEEPVRLDELESDTELYVMNSVRGRRAGTVAGLCREA